MPPGERIEPWTYGGVAAAGQGTSRRAVWYDPDGKRHTFAVDKGTHYVVAGVYELRLTGDPGSLVRHGLPKFLHRHPDPVFTAQVEAAAYAAQRKIADGVMERRMARDGGALAALIAPVVKVAAGMPWSQRDALVAVVTREIYRAPAGRRDYAATATEGAKP